MRVPFVVLRTTVLGRRRPGGVVLYWLEFFLLFSKRPCLDDAARVESYYTDSSYFCCSHSDRAWTTPPGWSRIILTRVLFVVLIVTVPGRRGPGGVVLYWLELFLLFVERPCLDDAARVESYYTDSSSFCCSQSDRAWTTRPGWSRIILTRVLFVVLIVTVPGRRGPGGVVLYWLEFFLLFSERPCLDDAARVESYYTDSSSFCCSHSDRAWTTGPGWSHIILTRVHFVVLKATVPGRRCPGGVVLYWL